MNLGRKWVISVELIALAIAIAFNLHIWKPWATTVVYSAPAEESVGNALLAVKLKRHFADQTRLAEEALWRVDDREFVQQRVEEFAYRGELIKEGIEQLKMAAGLTPDELQLVTEFEKAFLEQETRHQAAFAVASQGTAINYLEARLMDSQQRAAAAIEALTKKLSERARAKRLA